MSNIWLGLFSGIAFGFVIQRVGATSADRIAAGHLMKDPAIPQFMLGAVALAAVGLYALQTMGLGHTRVLPTSLVATGVGGVIFGIGWGLSGYCPGTSWAAAGEGRMDAIYTLLGGMAGAAAFAHVHEILIPKLYLPTNQGQITLSGWLGGYQTAVWVLFAVFMLAAWFLGRITDAGRV